MDPTTLLIPSLSLCANVHAIDICSGGKVSKNYDYRVTSPNYPREYNRNANCNLTIIVPDGNAVLITINSFLTESVDFVEIKIGPYVSRISGSEPSFPGYPFEGDSISFRFVTDGSVQGPGFDISYAFVSPTSTDVEEYDNFNGIIRPNITWKAWYMVKIKERRLWTRYLYFHDIGKCSNGTMIYVSGDKGSSINLCAPMSSNFYSAKVISVLIFSNQEESPLQELHYVSRRLSGLVKCINDFDCGDQTCVPMETKCDGFLDCANFVDEAKCSDEEFNVTRIEDKIYVTKTEKIVVNYTQNLSVFPSIDVQGHSLYDFLNGITFLFMVIILIVAANKVYHGRNGKPFSFRYIRNDSVPI